MRTKPEGNPGSGTIGTTAGLQLQVTNSANSVIALVDVGAGYTAGTPIDIGNGIRVNLSAGTTANGTFSVPVTAQPAQQIVLQESIEAVRLGEQRRDRVDDYLRAQIPSWSLFPLVRNLCALRGLDMIAGAGLAAAIGDPSRFTSAPNFMAYIGLVPSEHSSGTQRHMGAITNGRGSGTGRSP